MPASPFASFKNADLRFQVASGELVPDRNGNLRPGKAVIEVTALLQQKRDPNKEPRPGVDTSAVWVEGYLIEPRPLPSLITPDSPCAATWQGRSGRFFLEFTARNPYLESLDIDLVEKIRGYFQFGSFAVEGDSYQPPDPTTPSTNSAAIPFSYGDATPKTIATIPAGKTVFTVQVVVQTPFNGSGAVLTLGDVAQPERLMAADQNLPSEVGEYEVNPGYTYPNATDIVLTIVPGEGATQGSGFVLLEI